MLKKGDTFVFGNKLGEVALYDIKSTKNALKKFHQHLGAVKDLKIDNNEIIYSGNLKSWF